MSDSGDHPPEEAEGDAPPPSDEITEERLEPKSAPPPASSDDPVIDFTVTAELSGEETEKLLEWAKQYDHLFDEETVEHDFEVTQAAIATLPMPRDSRPPVVPLRIIAPPMPAPRMPLPSIPSAPVPHFESRVHAAVTPIVTPNLRGARPPATSTPVIVAHRLEPPRAPSPSGEFARRSQARSPVPTVLVVAAAVALLAGGIYSLAEHGEESASVGPAASTATSLVPPSPARVEEPAIVTPPAVADAKVDAVKKALGDLGEGLKDCVKRSAMVLPGSSPAVPARLEQTRGAGYEIAPNDFKTPVWSCANFHLASPLTFQMQWQLSKGGADGFGVAWLDDNGDGRADRAFAFKATLKARGQVELAPVEAVEASRAVVPVSY